MEENIPGVTRVGSTILLFAIFCLVALPCVAQDSRSYNLDFEELSARTGMPKGWGLGNTGGSLVSLIKDSTAGAYVVDSLVHEHGKYSLLIDWTKGYKEWTATSYTIKKIFKGDKIKLTGYIKTEDVTGNGAGLWMRLDGENYKMLGFDNMQDRAITGTTDWHEYSIELDYDEYQVQDIVVGGLIIGKGKVWMDNLHITIDGVDIAVAQLSTAVKTKPNPRYSKYITDDSLKITMRDGAKVSATIVRKRNVTEPQPVILMCDIYPGESNTTLAKYCAQHGYVGIIADTRGKRLGKEDVEPFEHDASDAYDIIDWISKQSWCNGKVGMYGGSYLGFSQWAAVKKVHPALKTIVPQVAVGPGIDFPATLGIHTGYSLQWLHYVMNNKLTDYEEFVSSKKWHGLYNEWYTSGKAFDALDTMEGRPNKIFHRWLAHPSYDAYWQHMVPYQKEFANIHIPILTITGYWDDDQRGAMYYFDQHRQYRPDNDDYLVIGPYDHYGAQRQPQRTLRGYTIDSAAYISITDLVFHWFDYILKDSVKPALLKDKINFEVMGTNEWRHVPGMERMNNDTVTFYLSNIREGNAYKLQSSRDLDSKPIEQEIDFAERNSTDTVADDEMIDDTVFQSGKSLKFVSEPLSGPMTINGSFVANLNVQINKKDMDVFIGLYQQLPNGRCLMLSENFARCSYIKNRSKRTLLKPGKTENIQFNNTFFTSRKLDKGSRIILLVGVNKNRNFEINYGTGKDVSKETIKDAKEPLDVQWFTNGSCIKLPVYRE